jgi:hypothetical protein
MEKNQQSSLLHSAIGYKEIPIPPTLKYPHNVIWSQDCGGNKEMFVSDLPIRI